MTDTVWWPVADIARHIVGCHPHWLYGELAENRPAWERFIKPGTDRLLLDADAVADYVAEHPIDLPKRPPKVWADRKYRAA